MRQYVVVLIPRWYDPGVVKVFLNDVLMFLVCCLFSLFYTYIFCTFNMFKATADLSCRHWTQFNCQTLMFSNRKNIINTLRRLLNAVIVRGFISCYREACHISCRPMSRPLQKSV